MSVLRVPRNDAVLSRPRRWKVVLALVSDRWETKSSGCCAEMARGTGRLVGKSHAGRARWQASGWPSRWHRESVRPSPLEFCSARRERCRSGRPDGCPFIPHECRRSNAVYGDTGGRVEAVDREASRIGGIGLFGKRRRQGDHCVLQPVHRGREHRTWRCWRRS